MRNRAAVEQALGLVTAALRRQRVNVEGTRTPDLSDLLWQIKQEWEQDIDKDRFRLCLLNELRATRNRWAHQYVFSTRQAHRAADTAQMFLAELDAAEMEEAQDLKLGLLEDLRPRKRPEVNCVLWEEPERDWKEVVLDAVSEIKIPWRVGKHVKKEEPMEWKEIETLGHPSKRTKFRYRMNAEGVTLDQTGHPYIKAELFQAALDDHAGHTLRGGLSMTDPPADGFGQWIVDRSMAIAGQRSLTPRHGSFIAAILVHENGVRSRLEGMAVWLDFPPKASKPN